MSLAVVYHERLLGIQVMHLHYLPEQVGTRLSHTQLVGEERLVEAFAKEIETCLMIQIITEEVAIDLIAVTQQEGLVLGAQLSEQLYMLRKETGDEGVPRIGNLLVLQGQSELVADAVEEHCRRYAVRLEILRQSRFHKPLIGMFLFNAKRMELLLYQRQVNSDNRTTEVEDDILYQDVRCFSVSLPFPASPEP